MIPSIQTDRFAILGNGTRLHAWLLGGTLSAGTLHTGRRLLPEIWMSRFYLPLLCVVAEIMGVQDY